MSIELLYGDCLELIKDIPNDSIDFVMNINYGKVKRKQRESQVIHLTFTRI